jgi:hypothetical protein
MKIESASRTRKGKREYLNDSQIRDLMKRINIFLKSKVEIPRIRLGKKQTIETLINEEALLLAKFLRQERKIWIPRMAITGSWS